MNSRKAAFAFCASLLFLAGSAQAQKFPSYPVVQGKYYKFEKIADGVYYASPEYNGTAFPFGSNPFFGANIVVIVNKDDVVLVDSPTTPRATHALLADIKRLTDRPVRTVINTHFHYDHSNGNSVFGPDVQIIAHDYVRHAIEKFDTVNNEPFRSSHRNSGPALIARFKRLIAAEKNPARKAALQKNLADTEAALKEFVVDIKAIRPTPPNVTYNNRLVLHRGGREIQLLFLGRGHTGGDTVVFLPKERIVATGDLMESRLAYMGNAFFGEWIATLGALNRLDWGVTLPGHGVPYTDKGLVTAYQAYLRDVMAQAAKLRAQGVSADEAAKRVDMRAHAKSFPDIEDVGAEVRGIRRLYAWMDETGRK